MKTYELKKLCIDCQIHIHRINTYAVARLLSSLQLAAPNPSTVIFIISDSCIQTFCYQRGKRKFVEKGILMNPLS